jgi:FMN phosphatase YigB (HAD superfamily)
LKKYKTLFFDVDDTLLDFGAAEQLALQLLFGMDTCWFNPNMKQNHTNINPSYQIHNLEEIIQIVRVKTGSY